MATPKEKVEGGAFYLDRTPQRKHIAGAFMTDGSFTKNTEQEVDEMMKNLEQTVGV
jgi:dehydrogenase/reductase SDR family protein 12